MDHHLDLRCHPLQFVCSPFEVEGEGELIDEVVIEMVGEVVVEMVRDVVHLSQHCLLPYPPYFPITRYFHTSILPHTYSSLDTFISPQTYTSLPYLVSPEPPSMAVDITLSSHPLSSPSLPSISETMIDLVLELGALPIRRPRAPRILQAFHPSAHLAPLASSTLFEIAQDPIDQPTVYSVSS